MASKGINKVIIVGNLGKDPEVRYSPAGMAFASFGVATSEIWKDKNTGEKQERTEWHNITISGKLAEIAGQYLTKGSQVYLEGRLQTRKWQDKQGADRYTTEIVVDSFNGVMQMLGSKQEGQQAKPSNNAPQQESQNNNASQQSDSGFNDDFDDSIPF